MQSGLGRGCLGFGRRNSRTITTVVRRQTGRPVRRVQGSELVAAAMVGPGAEVTKVSLAEQPGSPRDQSSRSSHAGHHSVESRLSRPTARMRAAYLRASLYTQGELSLCVGRICVVSAGGAYALALLAIGALGESVSLSDKTKPGR
jgi:hypothetical protein